MSASTEFTDMNLITIYDAVNPIDDKIDFFTELAAELQAKKIIDFGCGTGLLSHELVRRDHAVIGVEPAAGMIEQAKRKYGDSAEWIIGGYEKLNSEMQADMIIMTGHVAQFFLEDTEWNNALRAAHSSIVAGGYLIFESRNPLIEPFTTWPDSANHETIVDTPLGAVEWWCENLVYANGSATYELHYLFTKTGEEVISTNKLRFRTYDELRTSLEDNGFTVDRIYGGWNKIPFEPQKSEMIFVAKTR